MSETRTKNAILLKANKLREVDNFVISISEPKEGAMSLNFTLGNLAPIECELLADSDDLKKLKEWMESIAKDTGHASVVFGSGASLTCEITDIPESEVKQTGRYLDELFPSPICVISVRTGDGIFRSGVFKVKHFINQLYMTLLMGLSRETEQLAKEWYPYTKQYEHIQPQDFISWIKKTPFWHENLVSSALLDWYLQSAETYTDAQPEFKFEWGIAYVVDMWADYCCIFWRNGISIGDITYLGIHNLDFDFSDITGLEEWYDDFPRLDDDYYASFDKTEEESNATLQEIKEWEIKGFKLAHEIRKRLPINVVLLYSPTWITSFPCGNYGRIIFDQRRLASKNQADKSTAIS